MIRMRDTGKESNQCQGVSRSDGGVAVSSSQENEKFLKSMSRMLPGLRFCGEAMAAKNTATTRAQEGILNVTSRVLTDAIGYSPAGLAPGRRLFRNLIWPSWLDS